MIGIIHFWIILPNAYNDDAVYMGLRGQARDRKLMK